MDKLFTAVGPALGWFKKGVGGLLGWLADLAKANPKTSTVVAAGGLSTFDPTYWKAFFGFIAKVATFIGGLL